MMNNPSIRRLFSRIVFILVLTWSYEAPASWVHAVSDAANPRAGTFRIKTVAEEDDQLVGSATYNEVGHNNAVKIEGVETLDGRFWPRAFVEVADDVNGPWKRLDQAKVAGRTVALTLRFGEPNAFLYVNLDALRSVIGKIRYGRIALANGADTMFELTELLPTKASKDSLESDWQLNIEMGYLSSPIVQGPFFVGAIVFENGHLRAEAGYLDPEAATAAVIEGTKTAKENSMDAADEEFWVPATLQVTNDPKGEWKTIGQAPTPGQPGTITINPHDKSIRTLNIGVDILRPMIGKFGYGRAVLPNGKAAAFELFHLLPPKDSR
jgi:hypothetical protein